MKTIKGKTVFDKMMEDKEFKEKFDQGYKNFVISEKIAELRHKAHLTQEQLAKKVHTTKSAISRYENNRYNGYSITLLHKIAIACGADLHVSFVSKKQGAAWRKNCPISTTPKEPAIYTLLNPASYLRSAVIRSIYF